MTRDELRDVLTFAIKRAFISQPMGGITDVAYRDCADAALSAIEGAGYMVVPKDAHAGPVGNEVW